MADALAASTVSSIKSEIMKEASYNIDDKKKHLYAQIKFDAINIVSELSPCHSVIELPLYILPRIMKILSEEQAESITLFMSPNEPNMFSLYLDGCVALDRLEAIKAIYACGYREITLTLDPEISATHEFSVLANLGDGKPGGYKNARIVKYFKTEA